MFPVDVARLEFACGGVATVHGAQRSADTEAALGKIQAVADRASKSVVRQPLDVGNVNAAGEKKVLDQAPDLIIN